MHIIYTWDIFILDTKELVQLVPFFSLKKKINQPSAKADPSGWPGWSGSRNTSDGGPCGHPWHGIFEPFPDRLGWSDRRWKRALFARFFLRWELVKQKNTPVSKGKPEKWDEIQGSFRLIDDYSPAPVEIDQIFVDNELFALCKVFLSSTSSDFSFYARSSSLRKHLFFAWYQGSIFNETTTMKGQVDIGTETF